MAADSGFLDFPAAAAVNHVLRGAAWARTELAQHAGKCARFEGMPFAVSLVVTEDGRVQPAPANAAADATFVLSPGLLLRLAARDDAAWNEIQVSGDADFAACIHRLSRQVSWDVEEDLSRIFGDIAAHRMAGAARTLRDWMLQSGRNTARAFAEYWTEERPLIAAKSDIEAFNRDVDLLRDDVARLEKRIELLKARPPFADT